MNSQPKLCQKHVMMTKNGAWSPASTAARTTAAIRRARASRPAATRRSLARLPLALREVTLSRSSTRRGVDRYGG